MHTVGIDVFFKKNSKWIFPICRLSYSKRRGRHNIGLGPSTELKEKYEETKCNFESKYRDPTGQCNNKKNPFTYGVAYTAFRR